MALEAFDAVATKYIAIFVDHHDQIPRRRRMTIPLELPLQLYLHRGAANRGKGEGCRRLPSPAGSSHTRQFNPKIEPPSLFFYRLPTSRRRAAGVPGCSTNGSLDGTVSRSGVLHRHRLCVCHRHRLCICHRHRTAVWVVGPVLLHRHCRHCMLLCGHGQRLLGCCRQR